MSPVVAPVVAVAAVGLAVCLLAGVPAVAHVVVVAVAVVAAALVVVDRVAARRPLAVPIVVLPLLVGALLTALSLVPLPSTLHQLIAPESLDRLARTRALLDDSVAGGVRHVLSFDPPETALALLRLVFAGLVAVVVAHGTRSRDGRLWTFRALLVVAFVTAFGVLFAQAVGIPRLLDVVGVPVNPNHRARVCGALSLLCLLRALTLRARVEATWFGTAGVALALLVLSTMSKGGILALAVGVVVAAAVLVRRPADAGGPARVVAPAVAAVVVVALFAAGVAWLGDSAVTALSREAQDTQRLKIFLWAPALRVALIEPFVGVGNNAFASAFPSVLGPRELDSTLTYSHPENLALQTFSDHGVVAGLVVVFAAVAVALVVVRRLRAPAELCALPALCFLLVGDLFDFVLETPAGLGLAAVCLGLLGGRLAEKRAPLVALSPVATGVALAVAVGVSLAATPMAVFDWRYRLDDEVRGADEDRVVVLERALAAHPSDASYAAELAVAARHDDDPWRALRFANRAVVLWPALRSAHLEAARALFAIGHPRQGLLEYRAVWDSSSSSERSVVAEVARRTPDPALRRLALPQPERAGDAAALCAVLLKEHRTIEARACATDVLALPDVTPAHRRTAIELALGDRDVDFAAAQLALLPTPLDGKDAEVGARVRAAQQGVGVALEETRTWLASLKDPKPLLEWRLAQQQRERLYVDAEDTVAALRAVARSAGDVSRCDSVLVELRLARGDRLGALQALQKALSTKPRDLSLLQKRFQLELDSDPGAAAATVRQMERIDDKDRRTLAAKKQLWAAPRR